MWKKIRGFLLFFTCFFILIYGCIVVNTTFPISTQDNCGVKFNYSLQPFCLSMDISNYRVKIDGSILSSIRKGGENVVERIKDKLDLKQR